MRRVSTLQVLFVLALPVTTTARVGSCPAVALQLLEKIYAEREACLCHVCLWTKQLLDALMQEDRILPHIIEVMDLLLSEIQFLNHGVRSILGISRREILVLGWICRSTYFLGPIQQALDYLSCMLTLRKETERTLAASDCTLTRVVRIIECLL